MGKAKPTKKPSSPLKISTSLFQRKGKKSAGSSSGTDDDSTSNSPSPSPSPKKSMKAKSSKETKPKTSPKKGKAGQSSSSSGPSTSAAAAKQAKSGTKSKPAEKKSTTASKGKGTEKEKAGVKGKASKQTGNKGSSTASKTSKTTKEKPKSKVTKVSTLRKRSKSSSTVTSSSSVSTSSTTSSSSRSPSPAPKKAKTSTKSADSKKPTPAKKKAASGGKSGKEAAEKEKDKDKGKGNKSKKKPVKVTAAKPKGSAKPAKPKAKLKRMASLNAKAILEASFNSDSPEKKQRSPAVTPTKMTVQKIPQASTSTSTGTSMDVDSDDPEDFKPLTLLFSAPEPEPIIPKSKSLSPGGERKRKSSAVKIPQTNLPQPSAVIDRRDSISASIESSIAKAVSPGFRRTSSSAGTNSGPPGVLDNRCGPSVVPPVKTKKNEKVQSKSPTPKKKSKVVASSSVSTSTSPMERQEEVTFKGKSSSQPLMFKSGIPATKIEPTTDRSTFHSPFSVQGQSHHQVQQHSSTHSGKQKSASGQAKEKASKSSAPVAHFGSTVYQPAGPLIEPHKTVMTGSVPVGLLPDSVRIPSDLKVTYQAHPPTTSVLTHSTSSYSTPSHSSKGTSSSTKYASDHKGHGSGGASTSTGSSSSHSKSKILHQPYKSTSSSSVTIASSTGTVRSSTQVEVQQSSFGAHPGNFSIPGSSSTLSTATTGFLSQQSQMGGGITIGQSHVPSGALVPSAAAGSEPIPAFPTAPTASAGVYYGYGTAGSHSSPFTPSKYPFVAPDYRPPHSGYPSSFMYAPGNPQPTPNYFMAPFYSPPITPGGPASLGFGGTQSRALLAAHHPAAAAAGATTAAYYQSGPPLAHHPASSYYVAGPSLQPSHHSIQPTTAPGHAGPSPLNRSSQTACPSTSCPPNSNSTSNNSSTTSSSSTNNKVNRPLLPKRQPPQPSATNVSREVLDLAINKAKAPTATATKKRKECSTPALGADPPKTFSKAIDIVQSQAKQLESAKTFTEQYSLPDDITITPIIMSPGSTSASVYYGNGLTTPSTTQQRKRDIVHVIDPRSGLTTTIAKHISNNNILVGSSPSNVSPVKPNNAGNVGKISPDLDVIVIGRGGNPISGGGAKSQGKKTVNRRSSATQGKIPVFPGSTQPFTSTTKNFNHRMALSSSTAVNNNVGALMSGPFAPNYQIGGTFPITNLVQPLPQQILARSENTTKKQVQGTGVKRKGLSLNECIDGLKMKKKMRILGDTNISIKSAVMNSTTVLPLNIPNIPVTVTRKDGISQQQQKSGRKDNTPRQRPRKVNSNIGVRRVSASIGRRTTSTESDIGSTIINGPEAVAAASALVVLPHKPNGSTVQLPLQFSLNSGGKKDREQQDALDGRRRKPLKLKILGGKVITRSAAQNSKVKTRAKTNTATSVSGDGPRKGMTKNRQVLLRSKKDGNRSDSSVSAIRGNEKISKTKSKTIFPSYFNTVAAVAASGNGSSTLTTSNNHVILRIPKSSGEKGVKGAHAEILNVATGRYERYIPGQYQTGLIANPAMVSSSGSMTFNALKKRAIVKPLSSTLVNNGAIHSMPMANKKALPTFSHPRWSNGWTFDGESFEGRVYLRNDDQPVLRRCYNSMRHDGGDVIRPRDCVLLKSGPRKNDLPFVAKVAALWENPNDGEMMFSLLWYYRPEHTDIGRLKEDMPDEIFASRHRDCNSVATIEDKCYVLTYNEYCRYKKRMKQLQEGIPGNIYPPLVPLSTNSAVTTMPVSNFAVDIAAAVWSGISAVKAGDSTEQCVLTPGKVSPEVVFFCRKVYDYRQKRMLKNPS